MSDSLRSFVLPRGTQGLTADPTPTPGSRGGVARKGDVKIGKKTGTGRTNQEREVKPSERYLNRLRSGFREEPEIGECKQCSPNHGSRGGGIGFR